MKDRDQFAWKGGATRGSSLHLYKCAVAASSHCMKDLSAGRGAGFRDFLRLPSAKENRNAADGLFPPQCLSVDVALRSSEGVGQIQAGNSPAFSLMF